MTPPLSSQLATWDPPPHEVAELVTAGPAMALAGLFDCPSPVAAAGDALPPLWHWVYFLDRPAQRDLGPDGHPAAGAFMPPILGRRRMFAGGRFTCDAPIRAGDEITRRAELAGWTVKHGRTGELLFVTVRYTFSRAATVIAAEEQDLVYRSGPPAAATAPGPPDPAPASPSPGPGQAGPWELDFAADPVLLFRFSALTYNAHRIHYDAEYSTAVEGLPGLVVHGPLLALLCLELPRRHAAGRRISRLSFRARRPLLAGQPLTVRAHASDDLCQMSAAPAGGATVMTATGHFAP